MFVPQQVAEHEPLISRKAVSQIHDAVSDGAVFTAVLHSCILGG